MPLVSGAFPFRALHGQGWHGKYYLKGGFFFCANAFGPDFGLY